MVRDDASMTRWGYASFGDDFHPPADRRRFGFWATRRGIEPRFVTSPDEAADLDVVVVTMMADLSRWYEAPPTRTKIVYDIVDWYLGVPNFSAKSILRGPAKFVLRENHNMIVDYRRAIETMCRRADVIVCVTPEQRTQLLALNDDVHVILDAFGELGGERKASFARDDTLRLVWEGVPDNLPQFRHLGHAIQRVHQTVPTELHVVTALRGGRWAGRRLGARVVREVAALHDASWTYEWQVHTFPHIAKACDVAIVPLDIGDPLAAGKPENKLLSFWHLGLPTITSATPAYERVMREAGVSLTCRDEDEWSDAILGLALNEDARRAAAVAGAQYVDQHHTDQLLLERWDAVFDSLR